MYPRNNATPPRLAIGQVVQISDGAVQSSGVTITVRVEGGSEATGGGTTAYGADGTVYYTPTQAETNYTAFVVIANKASCFSASITVVTTATAVSGTVDVGAVSGDATAADNLELDYDGTGYAKANSTIGTATDVTNGVTASTVTDKTGYSISGTKTTLDALNDISTSDVNAQVDLGISDAGLDHLVSTSVTGTDIADNSIIAYMVSKSATADWDSFVNTTDALEAIADSGGGGPTAAQIADAVWDEATADHNSAGTYGKALRQVKEGVVSAESTVNDVSATTTSFVSALSEATDDHYNDKVLTFIDGALAGQSRIITDYNGTTKAITFDEALTEAPGNGDGFIILAIHAHSTTQIATAVTSDMDANSTQLAAIVADTNELQADWADGGRLDVILDARASQTSVDTVDTNVDAILVDTGTTLPASIATIDTNVDAILADTNELQSDWADGGRLDLILDTAASGGDATAANQTTIINAIGTMTDLGGGSDIANNLADIAGSTFATGTDSLEAIRNRGDAAWAGAGSALVVQNTTIATLASQTSFTLTAGSSDDDAYNGLSIIITDSATSTQKALGVIEDYDGATKTVTLRTDPGIFTMAVGDTVDIIACITSALSASSGVEGWLG